MATRDRLKDEFKNGNLATGERFAELIDSMKTVQEPVADPAASGTSLSFIASIEQNADGRITATKKTVNFNSDAARALEPFKGWYETGDTLPTTGFDGAYLYFKDTSELTGLTTIYRWNGTAYADTGVVVDTSNVQTFETGQAVNGVGIDNSGLVTPAANALPKAVDVKGVNARVTDMVYKENYMPVLAAAEEHRGFISRNLNYGGSTGSGRYKLIALEKVSVVEVTAGSVGTTLFILSDWQGHTDGSSAPVIKTENDKITVAADTTLVLPLPEGSKYLYIMVSNTSGVDTTPAGLLVTGGQSVKTTEEGWTLNVGSGDAVGVTGGNKNNWLSNQTRAYKTMSDGHYPFMLRIKGNAVNGTYVGVLAEGAGGDGDFGDRGRAKFATMYGAEESYGGVVFIPADVEREVIIPSDAVRVDFNCGANSMYLPQSIVRVVKNPQGIQGKIDDSVSPLIADSMVNLYPAATSGNGNIGETGEFVGSAHNYDIVNVSGVPRRIMIELGQKTTIAFLKSDVLAAGQVPSYCDGYYGRQYVDAGVVLDLPEDCDYLYIFRGLSGSTKITYSVKGYDETSRVSQRSYKGESKLPRRFETRFQVLCECAIPQNTNWSDVDISHAELSVKHWDNAVLYLPDTYTEQGAPTKLILFCKQGDSKIGASKDLDWRVGVKGKSPVMATDTSSMFMPYLVSIGYAVLAVDGEPDGWVEALNLGDDVIHDKNDSNIPPSQPQDQAGDLSAYGNYVAVQSMRRAYDKVMEMYNLDPKGCYVFAYSQGGLLAQNLIDIGGLPILAAAEISPSCSIHWHQWDVKSARGVVVGNASGVRRKARLMLSRMYGFGPSIEATTPDLETGMDWESIKDHLCGYDPWSRNVEDEFGEPVNGAGGFVQDTTTDSAGIYRFADGVTVNSVKMKKHMKCPLKVWCAEGDEILGVDVMKAYVKAVKNAGGVADIVIYESGGHTWFASQDGGTVTLNGVSYSYKNVAKDIAIWFANYGGY